MRAGTSSVKTLRPYSTLFHPSPPDRTKLEALYRDAVSAKQEAAGGLDSIISEKDVPKAVLERMASKNKAAYPAFAVTPDAEAEVIIAMENLPKAVQVCVKAVDKIHKISPNMASAPCVPMFLCCVERLNLDPSLKNIFRIRDILIANQGVPPYE